MSLSVVPGAADLLVDLQGPQRALVVLAVTNLSGGANSIPHGLPRIPRRVWFTPIASGATGPVCALNTATVAAGFDGTYIYVYASVTNGTSVLINVEY